MTEPVSGLRVFRAISHSLVVGRLVYNADEFRMFADACILQANELGLSKTQRDILLRMAAKWLELADDAERIKDAMGDAIETVAGASKVPTSSRRH